MKKRDFILGLLATPGFAFAHEGHGASQVSVSVEVIKRRENTVHLLLTMLNKGTHMAMLKGASVEGAEVLSADWAKIPSGALVDMPLGLQFSGPVPGIFTLMLDFGDAGHGPVVVKL